MMLTPPQVVYPEASSLCSLGMRPHLMTGFLRQHMIDHFSQPAQIEHPNLREYLWRTGLSASKISIESLTQWRPQDAGSRPAILIRRNSWQVHRMGIGDTMQSPEDHQVFGRYSTIMQGSHTLFCLSREPGECETLAAETYRELLGFSQVIRSQLNLLRFVILEIDQLLPVAEAKEHFGIAITVAYAHNESWTVRKHTPILRTLDLSAFRP